MQILEELAFSVKGFIEYSNKKMGQRAERQVERKHIVKEAGLEFENRLTVTLLEKVTFSTEAAGRHQYVTKVLMAVRRQWAIEWNQVHFIKNLNLKRIKEVCGLWKTKPRKKRKIENTEYKKKIETLLKLLPQNSSKNVQEETVGNYQEVLNE